MNEGRKRQANGGDGRFVSYVLTLYPIASQTPFRHARRDRVRDEGTAAEAKRDKTRWVSE